MKKLTMALLVLVVLAATAMPALAAGGPPSVRGKSGSFTLAGVITAISGTTVMVQVTGGNPIVREYIGQSLALQTTSSTHYPDWPTNLIWTNRRHDGMTAS